MTDESYIQTAIELAKRGQGYVSPNPLVGCVIVKDERIIGTGYHQRFGENHAEVNAILSAKENLEGATLYVNLEPCSHYGNTPPCVDKIIESKIKRVVIGTLDTNPLVSGRGVRKLKRAGINVRVGVLEKECIRLNKFFFKFISKGIPYVTLKAAITLDAKIADTAGDSKWISSLESRKIVHSMRAYYDAVLIGYNTVVKDNPQLTVRLEEGRNPKRIVIDKSLRIKTDRKIFRHIENGQVIIVTSKNSSLKKTKIDELKSLGAEIVFVTENEEGKLNLKMMLRELCKMNITSILVEGGREVFTTFIRQNLFDEIKLFVAPKILGSGINFVNEIPDKNMKNLMKLSIESVDKIGDDVLIELIK